MTIDQKFTEDETQNYWQLIQLFDKYTHSDSGFMDNHVRKYVRKWFAFVIQHSDIRFRAFTLFRFDKIQRVTTIFNDLIFHAWPFKFLMMEILLSRFYLSFEILVERLYRIRTWLQLYLQLDRNIEIVRWYVRCCVKTTEFFFESFLVS